MVNRNAAGKDRTIAGRNEATSAIDARNALRMLGRAQHCNGNQNGRKMATFLQRFGEVLYGGIRVSHPGHGGEECVSYLSWEMKVADTLLVAFLMVPFSLFALKQYSAPCVSRKVEQTVTQKLLVVLLSCVLGIQIGYKICDHSLLYMLNPCHIMTVAEVGNATSSIFVSQRTISFRK